MTTIVNKQFEPYVGGWGTAKSGSSWGDYQYASDWSTEGPNSAKVELDDFLQTDYIYYTQTINFDSDFELYWDYYVHSTNSSAEFRVYIDGTLLYNQVISSGGEILNTHVSLTSYRGNHTIKIGIYAIADNSGNGIIAFDNMRLVDEIRNKYVDISTGSDSDSGDTWVLAYQTVKKGIDNCLADYYLLHIAEGDYSAQAAIDLDKNLSLLCEDYGGGNSSPPLTVTLPATV